MSGKSNEISNWRYICLGVITVLVVIIVDGTTLAKIDVDEIRTIPMGSYFVSSLTEVRGGDILNVNIQVINGGPVDILLMESSDYVDYLQTIATNQGGEMSYYSVGSALNAKGKIYSFTFPKNGDYYIIIDNTYQPQNGATPRGEVDVRVKRTVVSPDTSYPTSVPSTYVPPTYAAVPTPIETNIKETQGFEAILAIFVIVALVFWRR